MSDLTQKAENRKRLYSGSDFDIYLIEDGADQEAFANAIRSALSRTPASGEGR
jgi:hypothetical protein